MGLCMLLFARSFAQNPLLAEQYYADGEFEKAISIYEELVKKNPGNPYYFDTYIQTLIELNDFSTAQSEVQKKLKKNPNDSKLYLLAGKLSDKSGDQKSSQLYFEKAISSLTTAPQEYEFLSSEFINLAKYDLAIKTLKEGQKKLGSNDLFAMNLADLYRRSGAIDQMIITYVDFCENDPSRVNIVKSNFSRSIEQEDFLLLKEILFERSQKNPTSEIYPELLEWVYIQEKDYSNAFRQVKALDTKRQENGFRIFELAKTALNEKAYDDAIPMLDYLIEKKGPDNALYYQAHTERLTAMKEKILAEPKSTIENLTLVANSYQSFFQTFGKTKASASLMRDYAALSAYYLNNNKEAIDVLNEVIALQPHKIILAESKIDLADIHVIDGERWEATLLYAQVDKDFKDDELGQEARFKNARLSYFFGDFEWAQAQFSVLKASTSKLIANDALDLSVFITDNSGLDTTYLPLQKYADAELLAIQRKYADAFDILNNLSKDYPTHNLDDDIAFAVAKIYLAKRDYQAAYDAFLALADRFPESIRKDNSIFEAAKIAETIFNNKTDASALYKRIILEHNNSTFAVESRKKYREYQNELP